MTLRYCDPTPDPRMSMVTCGYCRESFEEDRAQPTCGACPLSSACNFVRCPHCGYENPATPAWITRLRGWLKTQDARDLGYGEPAGVEPDAREGAVVR